MKKLLTILYVIVISNTYAQSPQGINYQSIIRNSAGTVLPSTAVLIEFKLYNSLSGPLVYLENHNITTNSFGMANVIIGQGTPITGSFNTINWANGISYEVYINSNLVGTKQLFMSVPYALFSPLQPLNLSGNILSSGSTSNSVTLTSGTTYTNGAGISILSGSIITNTAPNQTVILTPGNSNITIGGAYPSYSVSSTSTLSLSGTSLSISNGNTVILPNPGVSTSITPSSIPNNNILITGTSPSYTIGAPSYSISNPTGNNLVINNGLNSSSLNFNPLLTGDAIGPVNSNTVASIQGKPISPIIPTPGQVLLFTTGSVWTPTTLTAATTTILPSAIPNNNILITGISPLYTIGAPSYSISNPGSTNNLVINNGLNSSTLNFNPILTGDAIGPVNSNTVASIQGKPISPIIPTPGQVLLFTTGSVWTPTTLTAATTTILPSAIPNNNILITGISPLYTIGAPSYSISNPGSTNNLVINNGINSSTVAIPSQPLSLLGGILSVGSNTINLSNPTNGFWSVKGNLGTLAATNFIGTTDAVDLNFRTSNVNRMTISSTGNIGLGITTPTNIFTIGNVGLEKFNISSINGSMNFLDDQASITFPIAGPIAKPMIHMFASGTTNSSRMVIAHSSAFPNYGLQYEDASDRFNFIGNGNPVLTADLTTFRVGIGTTSPIAKLDIAGNIKITDGTQAIGKVLTSDAVGTGTWNYPLSPIKVGNYASFLTIANSGAYTYYTGANLLVITPTISGVVLLNFNGRYNFNISVASQISFGIYINTTGVAPTTGTSLTAAVTVGWAIPPSGGGFGDIPVSFTHTLNVVAGTTYYVWVGAYDLNFNQAGASFGPVSLTATLHQASGL